MTNRIGIEARNAFERGQLDYQQGRRQCPFTVEHKVEAWRDGWLTEQTAYLRCARAT